MKEYYRLTIQPQKSFIAPNPATTCSLTSLFLTTRQQNLTKPLSGGYPPNMMPPRIKYKHLYQPHIQKQATGIWGWVKPLELRSHVSFLGAPVPLFCAVFDRPRWVFRLTSVGWLADLEATHLLYMRLMDSHPEVNRAWESPIASNKEGRELAMLSSTIHIRSTPGWL